MSPIDFDGANSEFEDTEATVSAFAANLLGPDAEGLSDDSEGKKKRKPVEAAAEEEETSPEQETDDETSEETPEDETDEEGSEDGDDDETDDEEKPEKREYAAEGVYTKVKVDGEEHEVSIKELTRLYGQEKALTQRSQEVARVRKDVDAQGASYLASANAMLARAQARLKPYAELDFLALSRDPNVTNEELTALREQAQAAHEEVQFLSTDLNNYMQRIEQQKRGEMIEAAKASSKELSDPEKGIPGWNQALYDDIRAYAVSMGVPEETANTLVDAPAIRIIHKAMMFDRGAKDSKTGERKIVTKKVHKGPRKVVKTTKSPSSPNHDTSATGRNKALKRLQETGSSEDAQAAFLATLVGSDDND